ncbi:MAG TPA: addiction module protein [Pyrinomonadaceae bacterium]|jgi:putative addiction module component (TIGR02574 family)|nr:addiction module protein [Pyrinomonadaceae bacterium]
MATTTDDLLKQVLGLPPGERARLAEQLLESLESPNERNRALWAEEAERRVEAYERGELEANPAEEVFARLHTRFPK